MEVLEVVKWLRKARLDDEREEAWSEGELEEYAEMLVAQGMEEKECKVL